MNLYIDELIKKIQEALEVWQNAYLKLEILKLDMKKRRQPLEYLSFSEFNQRAILALEILPGLAEDEKNKILIMGKRAELLSWLNSIIDQSRVLNQNLEQYPQPNYEWREINESTTFQILSNGNVYTNVDIANYFVNLNSFFNAIINSLGVIMPFFQVVGVKDLSERSTALAKLGGEARRTLTEMEINLERAQQHLTKIEVCKRSAEENQETISLSLNKTNSMVAAMEKDRAAINEIVAKTEELSAMADALKEKVNNYSSRFGEFDSSLQLRLDLFTRFEAAEKAFKEKSEQMENEIKRLMENADAMIRGATTAGLSTGLSETREQYDKKRANARNCFVGAILFLLVLSTPLILLMFPQIIGLPVRDPATITIYDWLGRIALMLPGTWLTYFFSKAYAEFFHLEREYAHKATLAKSIEGFKREAECYQEEITASVFREVLTSPSLRNSPKAVQNPAAELFIEKIPGMFGFVKKQKTIENTVDEKI